MFDYLDRILLKNLLRILSNFFLFLSKLISDYDKEKEKEKKKKFPWLDKLWPLEKKDIKKI
jgi:hypothetical protein